MVAAILAGRPLFQPLQMSGHDASWYPARYVEFFRGLTEGQLLPRWAADLGGGYGQPFFNYTPPLFYYLAAPFQAAGLGIAAAENAALLVLLLIAAIGMFLLARSMFGPVGALVSALAYVFAPYFLVNIYVRHAMGDFAACAFLPWSVWALWRQPSGGQRWLAVGGLSVAAVTLSSNHVALMALPMLCLFVAVLGWSRRSASICARGLGSILLGIGLSAFFWLPAFAERAYVHLERTTHDQHFPYHFVYPHQLVTWYWGYGTSTSGPEDGMSFSLGPIQLALAVVALALFARTQRESKETGVVLAFFGAVAVGASFLTTDLSFPLWERLTILHNLQFPWRWLSLAMLALALVAGGPFLALRQASPPIATAAVGAPLVALLSLGLGIAQPYEALRLVDADYAPAAIASRRVEATLSQELEPTWQEAYPSESALGPPIFVAGSGRAIEFDRTSTLRQLSVDVDAPARMRLRTLYFPGWTVSVDGAEAPVTYDNPDGLMEISLPTGHHVVRQEFKDTQVRIWATVISVACSAMLLLVPVGWWVIRRFAVRAATGPRLSLQPVSQD